MAVYTEKGKVRCQICGKLYNMISTTHLKNKHGITTEEYKEQFPDAPLTSDAFISLSKYKLKPVKKEKSKEQEIIKEENNEEVIIETIYDNIKDEVKKEKILESSIGDYINHDENRILSTKNEIYDFLSFYYPNMKKNYIIEKFLFQENILQYQFISDFADPVEKINIEFVSMGWHNIESVDANRDAKLKSDGWTIIRIKEKFISVKEFKKLLK